MSTGSSAAQASTAPKAKSKTATKANAPKSTAKKATASTGRKKTAATATATAAASASASTKGKGKGKTKATTTTAASSTATTTKRGNKRKTKDEDDDEEDDEAPSAPPAPKKPRVAKEAAPKRKIVLNGAPTQRLDVFVCGEGSAGELGLGTAKNAMDVKRPRLNANLSSKDIGVVQVACGGMHAIALTHEGKVLTWGVNDDGALGRDTTWDGGLRDMDDNKSNASDDSDESDNGLNPREANPGPVIFPEGAVIVKVAAGDSISLALTDDGRVFGWGKFRVSDYMTYVAGQSADYFLLQSASGPLGFWRDISQGVRKVRDATTHEEKEEVLGVINEQRTPHLYTELADIVDICCGNNHCLARNKKGMMWAWGCGEQNQLGRRIIERHDIEHKRGLIPQPMRTGRTAFKSMFSAPDHSFSIDGKDRVYAWGLNGFGTTGLRVFKDKTETVLDDVATPTVVKSLSDAENPIVQLGGGQKHSIAVRKDGTVLIWGLIDCGTMGVDVKTVPSSSIIYDPEEGKEDVPRVIIDPFPMSGMGTATYAGSGTGHCIVLNTEGKAYSWGLNATYQLGLGHDENVAFPTLIDNRAVHDKVLNWAGAGGQFSILTAPATIEGENTKEVNGKKKAGKALVNGVKSNDAGEGASSSA